MSERGSFVTEYIYCDRCLAGLTPLLAPQPPTKWLTGHRVPSWEGGGSVLPIIAGKAGGCYPGEEVHIFEDQLMPLLRAAVCHDVRIAVLPDSGPGQVIVVTPSRPEPTKSSHG